MKPGAESRDVVDGCFDVTKSVTAVAIWYYFHHLMLTLYQYGVEHEDRTLLCTLPIIGAVDFAISIKLYMMADEWLARPEYVPLPEIPPEPITGHFVNYSLSSANSATVFTSGEIFERTFQVTTRKASDSSTHPQKIRQHIKVMMVVHPERPDTATLYVQTQEKTPDGVIGVSPPIYWRHRVEGEEGQREIVAHLEGVPTRRVEERRAGKLVPFDELFRFPQLRFSQDGRQLFIQLSSKEEVKENGRKHQQPKLVLLAEFVPRTELEDTEAE